MRTRTKGGQKGQCGLGQKGDRWVNADQDKRGEMGQSGLGQKGRDGSVQTRTIRTRSKDERWVNMEQEKGERWVNRDQDKKGQMGQFGLGQKGRDESMQTRTKGAAPGHAQTWRRDGSMRPRTKVGEMGQYGLGQKVLHLATHRHGGGEMGQCGLGQKGERWVNAD